MYKCSLCQFATNQPSILSRHYNNTSHQKIAILHQTIFKNEKQYNFDLIKQNKKEQEENRNFKKCMLAKHKETKRLDKQLMIQLEIEKLDMIIANSVQKRAMLVQKLDDI